jgi:hypothetical protein
MGALGPQCFLGGRGGGAEREERAERVEIAKRSERAEGGGEKSDALWQSGAFVSSDELVSRSGVFRRMLTRLISLSHLITMVNQWAWLMLSSPVVAPRPPTTARLRPPRLSEEADHVQDMTATTCLVAVSIRNTLDGYSTMGLLEGAPVRPDDEGAAPR